VSWTKALDSEIVGGMKEIWSEADLDLIDSGDRQTGLGKRFEVLHSTTPGRTLH
jgi:hypothetical protein